ncbi:MAG: hypothetical protein LQ345_003078 [Seirophora villosa]|nr:MAG: hypothetical protein LQ345_003078 [Seirophora villosa]
MDSIVHEATITLWRRDGFPADIVKVGSFYVRRKVVWLSFVLGYFFLPWLAIGLNFGFNRGICSSKEYRENWYLDGLCAGTYLRQIHAVPWYLHLWDQELTHSASSQSHADIPLHISRLMSSHARLDNPTLAIGHQLSKAMARSAEMAGHELSSSIFDVQTSVEESSRRFANASRLFAMEKDAMNQRLLTFINMYAGSMSRSRDELSWPYVVLAPMWPCLAMLQRHTGSLLLPVSKDYRTFVNSEIRFQMTRLLDESNSSLERINDSFIAIQQGPNSTSLSASFDSALAAVELYQQRLNERLRQRGGVLTWSLFFPVTSAGAEYRKLQEDFERSKRMQTSLTAIQSVITTSMLDLKMLQEELHFLRQAYTSISSVSLAAEGIVALPRAFHQNLGQPHFSWMRLDWTTDTNPTNSASHDTLHFHYDLGRADSQNNNITAIRVALSQVCNNRTNHAQVAGGGGAIHMICAIQRYATAFARFDHGLIHNIQGSWLMERRAAEARYEQSIGANAEHVAEVAINALRAHEQGSQVPEFLN